MVQGHRDGFLYFENSRKATDFDEVHLDQKAVVLGNGESRLNKDLYRFVRGNFVILACNAYYRDSFLHQQLPLANYLGAVDPLISHELLDSDYGNHNWTFIITERIHSYESARGKVPPHPDKLVEWNYTVNGCCGPEVFRLACRMGCDPIYLMGFDGPTYSDHVNCIYKETENYNPSANGIKVTRGQIQGVCKEFPQVEVFQVDNTWLDLPIVSFADVR